LVAKQFLEMAEEPERKVEAKITERTKVEEEMKRWERE
jgi:hypothetical protein